MLQADIHRIEEALGVQLPAAYKFSLKSSGLDDLEQEHPEFITDADLLIEYNEHFVSPPDPPSNSNGLWRGIKSFLLFGSRAKRSSRYRAWLLEWVGNRRFVVGSDLSEERYYVLLTEQPVQVHCYEL